MLSFVQRLILEDPLKQFRGEENDGRKRNFCLVTCLASRAVHLKVAFALDTKPLLNAFYRMVNRRGLSKEIIQITIFYGSYMELKN